MATLFRYLLFLFHHLFGLLVLDKLLFYYFNEMQNDTYQNLFCQIIYYLGGLC